MKVLFLAHRTPYPPNKGDKIRSYHFLSQLAERHEVSLAYWLDDPTDASHSHVLSRLCRGPVVAVPLNAIRAKARAIRSLTNGLSFSEGYYYSSMFQAILDDLLATVRPDVIYVFSSSMANYVRKAAKTIPTIVDFVDVDSEKWKDLARFCKFPLSAIYRLEHPRLARLEIEISRWSRCSLFVSEAEADLFRSRGGRGKIVAIPNGVDLDLRRLEIPALLQPSQPTVEMTSRPMRILFVGTMNYHPNADAVCYFAREIFPHIRRRFPRVVFDIVGRLPPRSVRRLGSIPGIHVHGEVEDLRSYMVQADVSIAPMRIARGVPNKILEAMAMGVPVVATTEAVKGICVEDGENALLADAPEAFSAQVIRLLSDGSLRQRITKRARQKVQETHNWKAIGNQLTDLIEEIRPEISPAGAATLG